MVFTPVLCPACFTMGVEDKEKDRSIKNNRRSGSWPIRVELKSKIKHMQTTKELRVALVERTGRC